MSISKRFTDNLGLIIGFLALIAAGLSLFVQIKKQTAQVTLRILAKDELTSAARIQGFDAQYNYLGRRVDHLWKVTIEMANTGTKNLVGEGPQSSLLQNRIDLSFHKGVEILKIETLQSNFPILIEQPSPEGFSLVFSQWNEGETALTNFYVASVAPINDSIPVFPLVRSIIDGDILVADQSGLLRKEPTSFYGRLPSSVQSTIMIVSKLVSVVTVALLLTMSVVGSRERITISSWKEKNSAGFEQYLESVKELSTDKRTAITSKPYTLPPELWKDFTGPRLGVTTPFFNNNAAAFVFAPLLIAMAVCVAIYAFLS